MASSYRDLVPALWDENDVAAVRRPAGQIVLKRDDWPVPLVLSRGLVLALQVQAQMASEPAVSLGAIDATEAVMHEMLRERPGYIGRPYPIRKALAGRERSAAKWAALGAVCLAVVLVACWYGLGR
jgi:hypothetical protein